MGFVQIVKFTFVNIILVYHLKVGINEEISEIFSETFDKRDAEL